MAGQFNKRQWLLGTGLLATLAVTAYVWVHDSTSAIDAEAAIAVVEPAVLRKTPPNPNVAPSAAKADRQLPAVSRDIFAVAATSKSKEEVVAISSSAPVPKVAAAASPLPVAPVKPAAPPLPFTYVGKLEEAGQYTVFLTAHGKSHVVKAGDTVAQTYRIEAITPPTMELTYLPMKIKQTMQIGDGN